MEPRETGDREAIEKAMNSLSPLDVSAAENVLREAKEIMDRFNSIGLPTYVILRPTDPDGVATSATQ